MTVSFTRELQIGCLTLLGIVLLLFGLIWKYQAEMKPVNTKSPQTVTAPRETYNWTVVKQHNTPADCWLVIDQQVYALSPYLQQHPGGAKRIANFCGQDASSAFNTGNPGGHIHSSLAKQILKNYVIGAFKG